MKIGVINKNTLLMGTISFLMSFSSAIIISCAINFSESISMSVALVPLIRTIGDSIGFVGKCLMGFLSDIMGDRRRFLLIGYGSILFIKPIFLLSCLNCFSPEIKILMFMLANVLEKFVGSIRDPVRDAWISDMTTSDNLKINLSFRKAMSCAGSLFGAVFSLFLHAKISYFNLFSYALVSSFIGVFLMYKYIHNSPNLIKIPKSENNVKSFLSDFSSKNSFKILILLYGSFLFLFMGRINEFSLWVYGGSQNIQVHNSLLFLVYYLSSSFGSILLNYITMKITANLSLIIFAFLNIIFNFFISQSINIYSLFFMTIFAGCYNAFLEILSSLIIIKYFHNSKWKASIISFSNLFIGFSVAFAGFFNKIFTTKFGLSFPFKFYMFPSFIGILFLAFLYLEKKDV